MSYIREGKLLETCGDFFDQNYVKGSRRCWRSPHICERIWEAMEGYGRMWKGVEGYGRMWKTMECGRVI